MRAARLAPLLLLALSVTRAEGDRGASSWYEHLRAARVALARDDLAAARPELVTVDSLVGGHSGAMYALAAIAAREGDRATALRLLGEYAATGLTRSVTSDTSFASLRGDPAFVAVAARLDSNGAAVSHAEVVVRLGDPGLLTEDVAWDERWQRFLVSSIHERKIVSVTTSGAVHDWIEPGRGGAWGIYALAIDPGHRRLWATTAASPTSEGYAPADSGRTALLAYDLDGARLVARVDLPRDGKRHVLGDMTLGRDGTVYVTESLGGGVYRLRPGAIQLDRLAPSGTFLSPQMPVLARDGRRLLVPDYPRGLAALDLGSGAVAWLRKPRALAAAGIDGLYRSGARLIAIQNGTTPHRVLELSLDRGETAITSWRVLEQASEWLGEPNHGTWVGRDLWLIGNSGWERVNDAEVLQTPADARPPVLMRLRAVGS